MRFSRIFHRAVARGAVAALALGLTLLAGLAVVSTRNTARAAAEIAATERISEQWSQVFLRISIEYEQLVDFVRADDAVGRAPLIASIGSAEENLRWLNAHGGRKDALQAQMLQNTYFGYSYTLRGLVDADERGDRRQVLLNAEQAALSASALRKQAAANVARNSLEIGKALSETQDRSRNLQFAVLAISGLDLALVLLCALVLLRYQRSTERQARDSRHRATHDGLTAVPNRDLLAERTEAALAAADRDGTSVGLLLLDLDKFKEVNDTLGHHAGDALLCKVADRLTAAARRGDTVARLGGDEFAVLLPGLAAAEDLLVIGHRMLAAVCGLAEIEDVAVDVSVSIGAALYPLPSADAAELLRYADIAMYTAKRGHLGVALYNPAVDDHTPERLSVLGELRRAIEVGELELHYQPKVCATTRELNSVESLVRWRHPTRGLIGPDQFIPVAEQNGLMLPLTDAILAIALAQHRAWSDEGLSLPVAVNVGSACLLDESFPARVAERLRAHSVPPARLTIEITETAMVTDPARATSVLAALRALGVRVSIDDFGTGYSSMSYLHTMPLDELKIDRQFTARIFSTDNGAAIVAAIIQLAHACGLVVVAEGVEDERSLVAVGQMGCELAQGYHICKPLPADEVPAWVQRRRAADLPLLADLST
jgi:diguanylate cyclase (GGDEF)-like protein